MSAGDSGVANIRRGRFGLLLLLIYRAAIPIVLIINNVSPRIKFIAATFLEEGSEHLAATLHPGFDGRV